MTPLLFAMVDAVLMLERERMAERNGFRMSTDDVTAGWWRSCWPVGGA